MQRAGWRATWRRRLVAGACGFGLLLSAGCKTSDDAAAAATQMAATAKSLSDYYSALGTILADTGEIYSINEVLFSKPFTPANRELLKSNQAELQKRVELAADFSTVAEEFAKLTGSTAPEDVAKSASKLQTDCDGLAGVTVSSDEQAVIKKALELLVVAVKEHKEREAARAIDGVAKGIDALFVKEIPVWDSTEQVYNEFASELAGDLVDQNATNSAALLGVALEPFGLTPSETSPDVNRKLAPLAKQQIADRKAAAAKSYGDATEAMKKSLNEMCDRVHLVAEGKPMRFRLVPPTLATVEQWVAQVTSQ